MDTLQKTFQSSPHLLQDSISEHSEILLRSKKLLLSGMKGNTLVKVSEGLGGKFGILPQSCSRWVIVRRFVESYTSHLQSC